MSDRSVEPSRVVPGGPSPLVRFCGARTGEWWRSCGRRRRAGLIDHDSARSGLHSGSCTTNRLRPLTARHRKGACSTARPSRYGTSEIMSAPTSGSADGSSIPGFYPDPSIPGYIRYWNGAAWVPGTSRPAPAAGEAMPAPPPSHPYPGDQPGAGRDRDVPRRGAGAAARRGDRQRPARARRSAARWTSGARAGRPRRRPVAWGPSRCRPVASRPPSTGTIPSGCTAPVPMPGGHLAGGRVPAGRIRR
ncbi:hypothetical protein SANTM175S_05718 [Streptomyces antimycoticus]